jgi:hypothetical protein
VVWKTSFPPGRSSRAALGTQRAGSHHKLAPHSEMARSKLPRGSGTSAASASMSGKGMPKLSWQRRTGSSWEWVTSTPVGRAPRRISASEDRPAGPVEPGQGFDAAQHGDLVPQHGQLGIFGGCRPAGQDQPAAEPDEDEIAPAPGHGYQDALFEDAARWYLSFEWMACHSRPRVRV